MPRDGVIKRQALRLDQHPAHPLYLFTLSGEELLALADVQHARRDAAGDLQGYQRPEVKRHVKTITRYLDGPAVLFPNPVILALPEDAEFHTTRGTAADAGFGRAGVLHLRVPGKDEAKRAWVVDGQQRMLAIAKSKRRAELVVPVNAFVAKDVEAQREHFIRVNSSQPLPRRLLAELLPHVDAELSDKLDASKLPSALCDALNQDPQSPFFGLVWRSSMSKAAKERAVCMDTSVIRMLEDSLNRTSGCLFPYRNLATREADIDGMLHLLVTYWSAVRDVWPNAWGVSPRESRLMHGVGIRAMGRVMDKVMTGLDPSSSRFASQARTEVRRLRSIARWTDGEWEDLGLAWNQVMNTATHVRQVSRLLVDAYLQAAA